MNMRWKHDHEYFQRMIEWEQRMENEVVDEVVGAVITNLHELLNDESSSDDDSMSGLQERGREDSSSSDGSSMPPLKLRREDSSSSDGSSMPLLQDRAREDSSSDDDTKSYDEDGIYDDGKRCGYKARTLKQIIGGDSSGLFPNNRLTLFTYSLHGYAQIHGNRGTRPKSDFYQAKE